MDKNEKGITLIALVVTIVVLLILAGVSLNLVLGNNGLIAKAKEARDQYADSAESEQIQLDDLDTWLEEEIENLGNDENEEGIEETYEKAMVNVAATKKSTINGEKPSASNPIIPEGYIPINTDTTSWGDGTKEPTQNDVDRGLVITDSLTGGNEWVWVPVPTPSDLYTTTSPAIAITGGKGKKYISNVKTKKYTKSSMLNGGIRVQPNNTSGKREPDVLVGNYGTEHDAQYYADAGFTSLENMAKTMVAEYSEMIGSIEKYKGFYIGRYELSSEGVKKNQPTLTNSSWYTLYAKCKTLAVNNTVKTRMVWGCQWDATCNWIANNGDRKSITDARDWGNFKDSIAPANTGNYEQNRKKNTGSNEAWKANNLYDIAGNCGEWTQEATDTDCRVYRSGFYWWDDGSSNSTSGYISGDTPGYTGDNANGSRPILIV